MKITQVIPQQHKATNYDSELARGDAPFSKLPQLECGAWLGDIQDELMTPSASCESHEANGLSHALPAATHASATGL